MKRLVWIVGAPLFTFAAVAALGAWLTQGPAPAIEPPVAAPEPALVVAREAPPAERPPAAPVLPPAPPPQAAARAPDEATRDDGVPRRLVSALEAVAPELALCVNQHLIRDRGPVTIAVHFRPTREGAFAPGTQVETSWGDDTLASCVAEVFEEVTFWPTGQEHAEEAFVFHLPDDAISGVAGLRYSEFQ